MRLATAFFLILLVLPGIVRSQIIRGEVLDIDELKPVDHVTIDNIHTSMSINTGADGSFVIAASSDQLLEFRKPGYKVTRVRIPKGYVPSFFRILVEHTSERPTDDGPQGDRYDYKRDSLRYHQLFAHELNFPRMSAIEKLKSPFSAMSKKNQMIWRFQDDFAAFEKEKYVDRTFNRALVTKMTGLQGDSLERYMIRFRPSYEALRGMNDYTFYNYIKVTGKRYRTPNRPVIGQ